MCPARHGTVNSGGQNKKGPVKSRKRTRATKDCRPHSLRTWLRGRYKRAEVLGWHSSVRSPMTRLFHIPVLETEWLAATNDPRSPARPHSRIATSAPLDSPSSSQPRAAASADRERNECHTLGRVSRQSPLHGDEAHGSAQKDILNSGCREFG